MTNENESTDTPFHSDFALIQKIFSNYNLNFQKNVNEAFLISRAWYNQCRNSIQSNETIPPIDNNDLFILDPSTNSKNLPSYFFFNRDKLINSDFIAVDGQTWNELYLRFGGGPEFSVPVVCHNRYETTTHPVTKFFDIFVKFKDNKEQKIVTYSEIKGKELEKVLCLFFDLTENSKITLRLPPNRIIEPEKNLYQNMISMNSHITMEVSDEDSDSRFPSVMRFFDLFRSKRSEPTSNEHKNSTNELPSPSEQFKIYKTLVAQNPTFPEGEGKANLLSVEWYELWKSIVDPQTQDGNQNQTIPPIDNHSLMIYSDEDQKLIPDRSKVEAQDFIILHPNVWKQLHKWYGGGPEVTVPVYHNPLRHKFVPAVEFIKIPIDHRGQSKQFEISKIMPLDILHRKVRDHYKIPDGQKTRLLAVDSNDRTIPTVLPPNGTFDSLSSTKLFDNNTHLILDYKDQETSKWHHQASSPSSFRESSSLRPIMSSLSNTQLSEIASNEDDEDTDNDHHIFTHFNDTHYSHTYYDRQTEGPGVCGLENIGNTCFFNSGIQCLVHTRRLVSYIMTNKYYHDINRSNPIGMHGELAEAFANLTKKIWSGRFNSIRPDEMKNVIGRFAPQFSGYGQQDSHELITFMLDGIHEDLNRVTKKPIVGSISGDGTNDEQIADESWKRYKSRNDSIVVDLFHSQLRSRLVCPKCKKVTVVFDPYMSLQLPIAKPNQMKLKVIFVPFDHLENGKMVRSIDSKCIHIKISIDNRMSHTHSSISEVISNKLGKKVNTFLLYREDRDRHSIRLNQGINSMADATHFALELPFDTEQKYAIVSLGSKMKKTYEYSYWEQVTDIMPPYFIPVPDFDISSREFLSCCENYFDFWSHDNIELNEKQKTFLNLLRMPDSENNENKFDFLQSSYFHLDPSQRFPNISKSIQVISLSNHPNGQFSYSRYLSNIDNLKFAGHFGSNTQINLDKCFKFFSSNETLDENNQWYCPHCKEFVCADKKMDIWSAPEVLVLQLKRFLRLSEYSMKKLDSVVYYPEIIDISKYLAGPQKDEKMIYRLFAVSEHCGSLGGGHYTAHARVSKNDFSENDGKWYSFNDSYVSKATKKSAHNHAAYVLFYERIDSDIEDSESSSDS